LILLHRGRFGGMGKFLGAHQPATPERELTLEGSERRDS
jgi:hypothetical protein